MIDSHIDIVCKSLKGVSDHRWLPHVRAPCPETSMLKMCFVFREEVLECLTLVLVLRQANVSLPPIIGHVKGLCFDTLTELHEFFSGCDCGDAALNDARDLVCFAHAYVATARVGSFERRMEEIVAEAFCLARSMSKYSRQVDSSGSSQGVSFRYTFYMSEVFS